LEAPFHSKKVMDSWKGALAAAQRRTSAATLSTSNLTQASPQTGLMNTTDPPSASQSSATSNATSSHSLPKPLSSFFVPATNAALPDTERTGNRVVQEEAPSQNEAHGNHF